MKVCAISDLHGTLPEIGVCDVVFICGDTLPLNVQRKQEKAEKWLLNEFCDWVKQLPCKTVYFIAGNHDFPLESLGYDNVVSLLESVDELHGKLIYVQDGLIEIEGGLTLYGCPWCTGPSGWAFIDETGEIYKEIPDCDVLLTHQPPKIEKLGCSFPGEPYERNFGSDVLAQTILNKNIKYCFCGHIHTGTHGGVTIDGCDTVFYNVSIKDEAYKPVFEPTYVEIEIKNE